MKASSPRRAPEHSGPCGGSPIHIGAQEPAFCCWVCGGFVLKITEPLEPENKLRILKTPPDLQAVARDGEQGETVGT